MPLFTYHNPVKGSHSVEIIYFAKFTDPVENIHFDAADHSDFGWFTVSDLATIGDQITGTPGDPEWKAIKRGFELLEGGNLNFGTS